MWNLIFNIIFHGTILQMGATAAIMWFLEDRVMEFSADAAGLAAFENFLEAFGCILSTISSHALQYMEGLAAGIIVMGTFLQDWSLVCYHWMRCLCQRFQESGRYYSFLSPN